MKNGRFACALALAALVLQAACSSMCKEMAADRRAFFARRATSSGPHATIYLPFAVADHLIARRMVALQPVGSPIKLPGRIGRFLGSIRLAPRRLNLRPAADDRVGLRLEVDLLAGQDPLVALTLDVDVRPVVDVTEGVLLVALRADDLRSIRASIMPDDAVRLAAAIRVRLPSLARAVVSEAEIASLARASIDYLAGHLGALLIDSGLMSALGELTRLRVDIPIVPVSRLSLHSVRQAGGGLVVAIFTDLPAAAGVTATPPTPADPLAVEVRLSADALAELGNRALATGLLPRRYDGEMHPKNEGDFTPGLRWAAGPRPFKIVAWRVKSPCLRARIGADPTLRIARGQLIVGIEHGEVEEVRGAALVRARVWMKRIGADAIGFTRHTLASARFTVAGVPLTGHITRAAYRAGAFTIDLAAD